MRNSFGSTVLAIAAILRLSRYDMWGGLQRLLPKRSCQYFIYTFPISPSLFYFRKALQNLTYIGTRYRGKNLDPIIQSHAISYHNNSIAKIWKIAIWKFGFITPVLSKIATLILATCTWNLAIMAYIKINHLAISDAKLPQVAKFAIITVCRWILFVYRVRSRLWLTKWCYIWDIIRCSVFNLRQASSQVL